MSFGDTSFQVVIPTALRIRNYEITTKHPIKFIGVDLGGNKKTCVVHYTHNSVPYSIPCSIDKDEVEIMQCRISDDQYVVLLDVKYEPRPDSGLNKITMDFEQSTGGNSLPHIKSQTSAMAPQHWCGTCRNN